MKGQALIDRYLLARPTVSLLVEFPTIVMIGILSEIFAWAKIPWSPYSNLFGGVVFLGGWLFHVYCHRVHKHAHEHSEQMEELVTTGVFSKMRHPMYLSLILMYLGLAVAWGPLLMLPASLLFSALTLMTAIKEEEFLLDKFGRSYEEYMQTVPSRFIPKIF